MNYRRRTVTTVSIFIAITCSTVLNFLCAQSNQEPGIQPATKDLVTLLGLKQQGELQETRRSTELRTAGLKEYSLGHFVEAVRLLQSAMALAVEASDTYHVALIHNDLGDIYQDEDEFAKAEQEFKKAIGILRQLPEHSHALALTLANFGGVLCKGRRYSEAATLVSEAFKLVKDNAINDLQLQVHLLDVSAMAYFGQRQFKKAETLYFQALKTLPDNAIIPEVMDLSNNLGTLYATKGDYPKAVVSYGRALTIGEKLFGPSHPNITTILGNLGFAYIHMRRYQDAESQFLRSLTILEENRLMLSPMAINTLYSLGRISMETNQLDRAQSLLARAAETGHAIKARTPEMAETLELYSTVLRRLSKRSEAENLHTEAALIRAELALTTRVGQ